MSPFLRVLCTLLLPPPLLIPLALLPLARPRTLFIRKVVLLALCWTFPEALQLFVHRWKPVDSLESSLQIIGASNQALENRINQLSEIGPKARFAEEPSNLWRSSLQKLFAVELDSTINH